MPLVSWSIPTNILFSKDTSRWSGASTVSMAQLPAQPVSFLLTLNGGFFCLLGTKIEILKKRDKADCIDCEAGQGGTADTDRLGPVSFNLLPQCAIQAGNLHS